MPNTYIGGSKLRKCFIGTTKVKKIYLGTSLVFQDGFAFTYNGTTYEDSAENSDVSFTRNDDGSFKLLLKKTGSITFRIDSLPSDLHYDICCVGGGASGAMGTGWSSSGTNHGGDGGKGGSVVGSIGVSLSVDTNYTVTIGTGGPGYFREGNDDTPNPGGDTSFGSLVTASGGVGKLNSSDGYYIFDSDFDSRRAGASGGPGGTQAGAGSAGGVTGGGHGGYFDGGYGGQAGSYWGAGGGGGASHWNDWGYRESGSGYQGVVAIRGRINYYSEVDI